jgi:hypothetical protein
MLALLLVPVVLQAVVMAVDEGVFHRRRGLPRWERIGHPVDTLSVAAAYAWLVYASPAAPHALAVYIGLAAFSSLLVTKDEPIHAKVCTPGEQWAHALLFVLHPVVFLAFGVIWWQGLAPAVLVGQLVLTLGFATYQLVYWRFWWKRQPTPAR